MRAGACRSNNCDVYEGEYKAGVRHGRGKLVKKNDSIYEGEFKDGEYDGQGVAKFGTVKEKDGTEFFSLSSPVFEGDFRMVFAGDFKAGVPHGRCTARYPDGSVYEGEWVDGLFEGHGKHQFKDGRVNEGQFKGGKFCG